MKIKFVTLASILALTSVRAFPAPEGPAANEGTAVESVNNAVISAEDQGVEEKNMELDDSRIGLIPIPIIDDLLKLLEAVIDFVIDILAGRSHSSFPPSLKDFIESILKILGSKSSGGSGNAGHGPPAGNPGRGPPAGTPGRGPPSTPAAVPATDDPIDIMKTFISNVRAGYSGMEAANDDPLKILSAAISLYSMIPKENLPEQQAFA